MQLLIENKDEIYIVDYDFEDIELVNKYSWHITKGKNNCTDYVRSTINGKHISLHRLIMESMDPDFDRSFEIDHADRNGLNNRRYNLRLATSQQNKHNRANFGKVEYVGVWKTKTRFASGIKPPEFDKQIKLGFFKSSEDAAIVYDLAAMFYFKEFANLNFPSDSVKYKEMIQCNIDIFKTPEKIRELISPKVVKYQSIESTVIDHLSLVEKATTNEISQLFSFSKMTVALGLKSMVKDGKLNCESVLIKSQKHFQYSLKCEFTQAELKEIKQ